LRIGIDLHVLIYMQSLAPAEVLFPEEGEGRPTFLKKVS